MAPRAMPSAFAAEGRTSLRERADGQLGWTLAFGASAKRTTAASRWRHTEHAVALEATLQPASGWLAEAKLGTARQRSTRRDTTLWSLGLEHALSDSMEAVAEPAGDDRERPIASAGLRYQLWPRHALLTLTYGVRLAPQREHRLGLGVTFEF